MFSLPRKLGLVGESDTVCIMRYPQSCSLTATWVHVCVCTYWGGRDVFTQNYNAPSPLQILKKKKKSPLKFHY